MNRRKDEYIKRDSLSDVQDLHRIAVSQRDKLIYKEIYYRRQIRALTVQIADVKQKLYDMLEAHQVDPSYPVFDKVLNDDVYLTDNVPKISIADIDITEARTRNFIIETTNTTKEALKNTFASSVLYVVNEMMDEIYKKSMEKTRFTMELMRIEAAQKEYADKKYQNQGTYTLLTKQQEKASQLYTYLTEFLRLLTRYPEEVCSEDSKQGQEKYTERYGPYYVNLKKSIKKAADKFIGDFSNNKEYFDYLKDTAKYFSSYDIQNKINKIQDVCPDQYIDAIKDMSILGTVIANVNAIKNNINKIIEGSKKSMDAVISTTGVGNSDVDKMVTSSTEILTSTIMSANADTSTLQEVSEDNKNALQRVVQAASDFKGNVIKGMNDADTFLSGIIAKVVKFPVKNKDHGKESLKNGIRDVVRRKYGGDIPFCDEVAIKNESGKLEFVRKEEIDSSTCTIDPSTGQVDYSTGKKKIDVAAEKVLSQNRQSSNILNW